jgi:hypothetical protein
MASSQMHHLDRTIYDSIFPGQNTTVFKAISQLQIKIYSSIGTWQSLDTTSLRIWALGIFSPGAAENTYPVPFFDATVAEVALLGEKHIRHLPMVYLEQRTTYQLSFDETSDKSGEYIVIRHCFSIAVGNMTMYTDSRSG